MEQYSLHQLLVFHLCTIYPIWASKHFESSVLHVLIFDFAVLQSSNLKCKNRPKGDRKESIELVCTAPQGTLNLFFLCFPFVCTLSSSFSISALNFVLSSHFKQELWLVSLQVFIALSRRPIDCYTHLWGQPGVHGVQMESERVGGQLRTDVRAENKWNQAVLLSK